MVGMSSFWAEVFQDGVYVSRTFAIPGFSVSFCRADFMHTCCLGILQYLSGNVMWELFLELRGSQSNWIRACGLLENMMKVAAKSLGRQPPFHSLTVGMLRANTTSKPKMKLKAAEGRYFLPVLHTMLTKFFPCQTQHAKTRLWCAEALLSVYSELDSWVEGVSTIRLGQFGRKHLLLYAELSKSSRNELRWHL